MTVRLRINAIEIDTTAGDVRYTFGADLTVLAGQTGVGKTVLLELIKFGFGGNGALADVVRQHVNEIALDITVGGERYELARSIDAAKRKTVRVTDLITGERLTDHHVENKQPSLNTLLMHALGLPDDMRAAAKNSSKAGARITFQDVLSFLYIPQAAINREIAHSEDGFREPKRKAVFELLFGLTSSEILQNQNEINDLNGMIDSAEKDHQTVLAFLRDSNTTGRKEAQVMLSAAEEAETVARARQEELRSAVEPVTDRETQVLRDLLNSAERGLADARRAATDLARQRSDYTRERHRVQADLGRLHRMHDAGERLADIEFVVCPRCMQSVTERETPQGSCRVCLQPDPLAVSGASSTERYESIQLTEQLTEMNEHLDAITRQIELALQADAEREQLVQTLTAKIDERTADRVTPRLQAFADAADRLAVARTAQAHLEQVLRQWDRADDLGGVVQQLTSNRDRKLHQVENSKRLLDARREEILQELEEEFRIAVAEIGIPGVKTVGIHKTNFLPLLNGQRYSTFSGPGGGIITATQIAYWTSLLTVALRRRDTEYPAFLLIDSPRLAINAGKAMPAALYRRLVRQADAHPGKVQLIIADHQLPADYRGSYEEIDFSYEDPTIPTIPHPGPTAVQTLGNDLDDASAHSQDEPTQPGGRTSRKWRRS